MRVFTKTTEVEVKIRPTPQQVAECFWDMDADEQAKFFHRLAEVAGDRLVFQLCSVDNSPYTTPAGRWAMSMIGEYAEAHKP